MIGSRFWGAGGRITPLWGLSPAAPGGLWRGTFEGFGGGGGGGGVGRGGTAGSGSSLGREGENGSYINNGTNYHSMRDYKWRAC